MNNIITFFSNFRYFKKYLLDEINKKTAERILGKKLNEFIVKHNLINSKVTTPKLFDKYKNICERQKI
jgi:hypothetical protein